MTTTTHTNDLTTEEIATDLSEGDVITVAYESNRSGTHQEFSAEVTNINATLARADGLFGWADVDLCRTATDTGNALVDDHLPRRRLSCDPGDSVTVEARATTVNGTEYRRISAIGRDTTTIQTDN